MLDWERRATVLAAALDLIGDVVAGIAGNRDADRLRSAADALTVIGAVVASSRAPGASVEDIEEEVARLRSALDDNDSAADDALAAKFDTTKA